MRRRLDQLVSKMACIACSVVMTLSSVSRIEKLLPVEKATVSQNVIRGEQLLWHKMQIALIKVEEAVRHNAQYVNSCAYRAASEYLDETMSIAERVFIRYAVLELDRLLTASHLI